MGTELGRDVLGTTVSAYGPYQLPELDLWELLGETIEIQNSVTTPSHDKRSLVLDQL